MVFFDLGRVRRVDTKGGISSLLSAVARAFGGGEERPAAAIVASADAAKDGQGFGAGLVMSPPSRLPSDVALLSKMPPLDLRTTSQKALVSMRALLYVGMAVLGFFLILFVRGREKSEKYTPWNFR